MKNKGMMLSLATLLFASATMAQGIETDDMYFNSKDRAALRAQKPLEQASYSASAKKVKKNEVVEEVSVNPTDSYSARNINPEFSARSNSQTALVDEQDYFVNNYKFKKASDLNTWNNNYSSWYGSPMYSASYYGSGINAWNSPYYGSYYDPWGSPWNNPYYRSGYSSAYSFYMGNSYNYGMGGYGMGMGMGLGYGYPYNSWSSWGSYGSGFGSGYCNQGYGYSSGYGYGGGYGGYPGSVIIVNNNNNYNNGEAGRPTAYGKRATRSGMVTSPEENVNYRTRTNYAAVNGDRPTNTGGRVSSPAKTTTQQSEYYNRSWRTSQQSESSYPSRNSSNNTWSSPDRSSSFDGHSRSNSNSGSSFSTPSRSSSFDGGGGGGATRSSAPASSGSNGRSRGAD